MQIAFAKIAVIASLLFPAINIAKTTTVFGAVEKSESYSFTLNALSDVSIGYKWTDLLVVKNGKTNEFNASSIIWTLTNTTLGASTTALTGSFADVSGQTIGKDTLSLTGLSAGTYSLNLAGQWAAVSVNGNASNLTYVAPTVNLRQGTFSSTPVTAVPEPETFAMMLAGLGLMGTIAMRRKNKAV